METDKSTGQKSGKPSKESLQLNQLAQENQLLSQELQRFQNLEAMSDKRIFRLSLLQYLGQATQEIRNLAKQVNGLALQFQTLNKLMNKEGEEAEANKNI